MNRRASEIRARGHSKEQVEAAMCEVEVVDMNFPWMQDFSSDENVNLLTGQEGGVSTMVPSIRKYHVTRTHAVHPSNSHQGAAAEAEEEDEEENQIEVLSEMFRCFDGKQWKELKGWGEFPQHLGAW